MTEKRNVEQLIKETDSLTYLNALKCALSELKEELSTIEQTREYLSAAVDRARKISRRIDNQYRAVVKCAQDPSSKADIEVNNEILELMENDD